MVLPNYPRPGLSHLMSAGLPSRTLAESTPYTARYVPPGSSARTCQTASVKPCNIFALSCFCRSATGTVRSRASYESLAEKPVSRMSESTSQISLRGCSGTAGTLLLCARSGIRWKSRTVARTVAVQKVTSLDTRNNLKMKGLSPYRSRPVTSEVAGSSPVVPAIHFQRFPSIFKYLPRYAVRRLATSFDTNRHEMPPILAANCSSYCSTW